VSHDPDHRPRRVHSHEEVAAFLRERRAAQAEARRRRRRAVALTGAVAVLGGGAALAVATGTIGSGGGAEDTTGADTAGTRAAVPARTVPPVARAGTTTAARRAGVRTATSRSSTSRTTASTPRPVPAAVPSPAPAPARAATARPRPVVWVQAGHAAPREPGYRLQTGAGSGAFGTEVAFTTRTSRALIAVLRRRGVDARYTPGLVTPWGARGAVFISIHHDSPDGHAGVGHAITGAGENYYHGEGTGTASPRPYPDSAPHRRATPVSARVAATSRRLSVRVARRFRAVFTPANGARTRFEQVADTGNVRMMRYYGYYRTRAQARVLVEAGAAGADDRFLARTDLIARALADGVVDHLRAEGRLPRTR